MNERDGRAQQEGVINWSLLSGPGLSGLWEKGEVEEKETEKPETF